MSDQLPLSYEYHVILARPGWGELLLLPSAGGWRLPGFSASVRRGWQDVDHVSRALRELYAAEVHILRCAAIDYERDSELLSKIYVAELRDPAWHPPPGSVWVGRAEAAALPLALPRQRAAIAEWFAWYADGAVAPATRAAWYRPGWHAQVAVWVAERLADLGIAQTGPPEQLRCWQRSAILHVPTAQGDTYFKALPPMFAHEPALSVALARIDPNRVVAPLAIDAARGWMLMPALSGQSLDEQLEIERWEAALRSFAQLQIASASRLDPLRSVGVPDRPLDQLATQIDSLFGDVSATLRGRPAGLSDAQRVALIDLAPRLREMCVELARYGLPASIEHGDFWVGQIIANPDGYIFLDWSDCSIAHPFFSLLLFMLEAEDHFPKLPDVRERLRDAYLEPWVRHTHMARSRLERAFELAQPLAALHHAITYQQLLLPNMELAWEIELMLPFYLKMLLRLLG